MNRDNDAYPHELPHDLEREHWTYKVALVAWDFALPCAATESPSHALRRHALVAVARVMDLANIERIAWTTASGGEDAAALVPGDGVDIEAIGETFEQLRDVVEMSCDLALRCTSSLGVDFIVRSGARLRIGIDADREPLAGAPAPRLYLSLSLHADLYSPRTFGRVSDNRELAAVNGPRLTKFLRAVRDEMGGTVNEVDAGSYRGLVSAEGFLASDV